MTGVWWQTYTYSDHLPHLMSYVQAPIDFFLHGVDHETGEIYGLSIPLLGKQSFEKPGILDTVYGIRFNDIDVMWFIWSMIRLIWFDWFDSNHWLSWNRNHDHESLYDSDSDSHSQSHSLIVIISSKSYLSWKSVNLILIVNRII